MAALLFNELYVTLTTFFSGFTLSTWADKFLPETLDSIESINDVFCMKQIIWDKFYQSQMDVARNWLKDNQQELLSTYNKMLIMEVWKKYAEGTLSHWEMEALCFYHSPHELKNVNIYKYNIADFNELQSNEVDYFINKISCSNKY